MDQEIETPPTRRFARLGPRAATALFAAGLLGGGLVGGMTLANAASPTPTPTPAAASGSNSSGAASTATAPFHSNEDATHEAGESAAREAAENNGTATFGPPPGDTAPAPGASSTN